MSYYQNQSSSPEIQLASFESRMGRRFDRLEKDILLALMQEEKELRFTELFKRFKLKYANYNCGDEHSLKTIFLRRLFRLEKDGLILKLDVGHQKVFYHIARDLSLRKL